MAYYSAICVDCFEEDKHVGHKYRLVVSGSGCCDCGDLGGWKLEGCCSKHNPDTRRKISTSSILPIHSETVFKTLSKYIVDSIVDPRFNFNSSEGVLLLNWIQVCNQFIDILGDQLIEIIATKNYNTQVKSKWFSMTVQLFTVDSIALKIVSSNYLSNIVKSLIDSLKESIGNDGYLIRNKSSFLWLLQNPNQMFEAFESLYLCQGMMENTRITTTHIEFGDDSWLYAVWLEFFLSKYLLGQFFSLFTTHRESLGSSRHQISQFKSHLLDLINRHIKNNDGLKWKRGVRDNVIPEYRVSKQPVSIYTPLHRALTLCVGLESTLFNVDPQESLSQQQSTIVLEHLLRIHALSAQFAAGMWVRNGESIAFQIRNHSSLNRQMQSDIHLLQYCAMSIPSQLFYSHILDRFELSSWFILDGTIFEKLVTEDLSTILDQARSISNGSNNFKHISDIDKTNTAITEYMLEMLMWLITDRIMLSGMSDDDIVRIHIIHILAVQSKSFGEITSRLPDRYENYPNLEKILSDISVYHTPTGTEKGKYELKLEMWREYVYFYPHYTRQEQQISEENYNRIKEKVPSSSPFLYGILPPILPVFNNIVRVLHCDILHVILFSILYNSLSANSHRSSERLISLSLHLLSLCLKTFETFQSIKNNSNDDIQQQQQQSQSISIKKSGDQVKDTVTSPKYDQFDFGFCDDITKNFHHQVRPIGSHFFISAANSSSYTFQSLLKLMLLNTRFEQHHEIVSTILRHPLVSGNVADPKSLSPSPEQSFLKKEYAKKRQLEMMKKFKDQQQAFLKNIDDDDLDINTRRKKNYLDISNEFIENDDIDREENEQDNEDELNFKFDQDFDKDQSSSGNEEEEPTNYGTCVMCKEEMDKKVKPFGYICYLHTNPFLSLSPLAHVNTNTANHSQSSTPEDSELIRDVNDTNNGFIGFCTHLMHIDCFKLMVSSGATAQQRVPNIRLNENEFHCPSCRRVSNQIIPTSKLSQKPLTKLRNGVKDQFFTSWIESSMNQPHHFIQNYHHNDKPTELFINTIHQLQPNNQQLDKFHCAWSLIASSISIYELLKRTDLNILDLTCKNNQNVLLSNINNNTLLAVNSLLKKIIEQSLDVQYRINDFYRILNIVFENNGNNVPFLKLDMFGMLVRMYICNETLTDRIPFSYIVKLYFFGTFIQALLCTLSKDNQQRPSRDSIRSYLMKYLNNNQDEKIESEVKLLCLPFLRRTSIFMACLNGECKEDLVNFFSLEDEYSFLLKHLGLDRQHASKTEQKSIWNQTIIDLVCDRWLASVIDNQIQIPLRSWKQIEFPHLPNDYHKFFLDATTSSQYNNGSSQKKSRCDSCGGIGNNRVPIVMCICCGKLFCQPIEYMDHPRVCRFNIGIFLSLNDSLIFLIIRGKFKVWGTVFLNQYGDEDIGLKKGKPIYLNQQRLDQFRKDLLTIQNIPDHNQTRLVLQHQQH
eukprot:gene1163-1473_t